MRLTKKKLKLLNRSAAALLAISGSAMGMALTSQKRTT